MPDSMSDRAQPAQPALQPEPTFNAHVVPPDSETVPVGSKSLHILLPTIAFLVAIILVAIVASFVRYSIWLTALPEKTELVDDNSLVADTAEQDQPIGNTGPIVVGETMQSFTAADCAAYPTPASVAYTPIGMLQDERDGKFYEIRKFADGKCWMVDDLRYGGQDDECANQSTFSTAPGSKSGSAWGYGYCRDPKAKCATGTGMTKECICDEQTVCGYHYNWQAVMQDQSAYFKNEYAEPTEEVQGICPTGWRLPIEPSSGNEGDFGNLFLANGGLNEPGAHFSCDDYQNPDTVAACQFFLPGGAFKTILAGHTANTTEIWDQGASVSLWTQTQSDQSSAEVMTIHMTANMQIYRLETNYKHQGNPVRCVKVMDNEMITQGAAAQIANPLPTPVPTPERTKIPVLTPQTIDFSCSRNTIVGTMQTWRGCSDYATPEPNNYSVIGCLTDERDGKSYEIRKFADGKCWMVDNLKFGGTSDECANKTAYNGEANKSNSAWGFGECRDPATDGGAPCNTATGICGYFYNWQAAIQNAEAYYGNNYVASGNIQGICPVNWHLPSRAEFAALDKANGGTGVGRAWCSDDVTCQFWLPGYGWKGIYSGIVSFTGKLNGQGVRGDFWTRDQDQPFHANSLSANAYNGGSVDPGSSGISKSDAVAIRCLAN